ncbi:Thermolysin metallopeptidase, catalytic domain [Nocardioides terrae]|uniref:Neutral metalloproteinase n=1 Tax=Nocardioides terrae TaxID=574651 RepID=A0A1I1EDP7_9ACTN|nr:protealysin inhibitor emfourin [Nocardioides terrae]SFB85235.1 Thermolysin metallopeptidase, catalytic domain [Nocardioides terrae]
MTTRDRHHCQFIPPYLIERLQPPPLVERDRQLRSARAAGPRTAPQGAVGGAAWVVHTCSNTAALPGDVVRSAGDPESGDAAVDEAASGIEATLALWSEVFGRSSFDGQGASVSVSVHYEQGYDNAFWDGTQLVFGDGDGEIFGRFTKPVDVLGHEFAHAVTERTAGLTYQGQSGALNESVSDVFGSCLKQRLLGQRADEADWLIGEGIFLPGVQARALRDMAHPGTAYDDPRLGKDPQVGHMDDYVDTADDNGGVHTNSGIPNRAFQLAATGIGGTSWDGAGRIWYAALTGGHVGADADFAAFAAATVAAAGDHAEVVSGAWKEVGVDGSTSSGAGPAPGASSTTVAVKRSGGFAGLTKEGVVDLDGDDERAGELRDLVVRVDVASLSGGTAGADRFVYDFDLCGAQCRVPEQHLTPDLHRIAQLVLR